MKTTKVQLDLTIFKDLEVLNESGTITIVPVMYEIRYPNNGNNALYGWGHTLEDALDHLSHTLRFYNARKNTKT